MAILDITAPHSDDSGPRQGSETDVPRFLDAKRSTSDRIYRSVTTGAAMTALLVMALIALFLIVQAIPAFRLAGTDFFTVLDWRPDDDEPLFGIASMLFGTVVIALVALVLAVPISIATAVFITEYLPKRLNKAFITILDLLAAVPSLIFGLWGLFFLQPKMAGLSRWLSDWLGFIPLFTANGIFTSSKLISGVVLAMMIIPVIASVSRAVIAEVPRSLCEAALALGSTRFGMVRQVVIPYSRGGLVGASMLGLGRAMGETIAIALILSFDFTISASLIAPGGASIAGTIALRFNEALDNGRAALSAAGLTLFVVTLLVNIAARAIVKRTDAKRGGGPQLVRAGK